jgi:hypothetical protein
MTYKLMIAIVLALGATAALADDGGGKDPGACRGGDGTCNVVTWDQFQYQCAHWDKTQIQRQPQNIVLQCSDYETDFEPAQPGTIALSGTRRISTLVTSSKFTTGSDPTFRDIPILSKGGTCTRFKEVARTYSIEHDMTCDEVLGLKGSPEDYCQSLLDQGKGSNPKMVQVADTGRVIDTCGDLANDGGPGKVAK